MKKLFLVLALLVMGIFVNSHGAFATCDPNTDKFGSKGWCIDQFGALTPKAITTGGTQTNNQGAIQVPVLYQTTAGQTISLTAQQSGIVITDSGGATSDTLSGSGNKWVLPRAVPGLEYTLSTGSKSTVTLDTLDISDTFFFSVAGTGLAMGDSIKNPGQAGDSVKVVCTKAGTWSVVSMDPAAWTANGTN